MPLYGVWLEHRYTSAVRASVARSSAKRKAFGRESHALCFMLLRYLSIYLSIYIHHCMLCLEFGVQDQMITVCPTDKSLLVNMNAPRYTTPQKLCMEGNPSAIAISFDPRITASSCNDAVCQLDSIQVLETLGAPGRFDFVFKGDRFLYQMVKGFVRALVAIGEKRLRLDELLLIGKRQSSCDQVF